MDANVTYRHACGVPAKLTPPTLLPDPDNLRGILAYWLRLHRVQKNWSQERLALECDLDRTYVSAVERLHWNVSLSNLDRFAQALGVPPWTLLVPPQTPDTALADARATVRL